MRIFFLLIFIVISFLNNGCNKDDSIDKNVSPKDFLSSKDYSKLIVEVQSVSGYAPSSSALNNLEVFLKEHLNKPAGITIVQSSISSPGKSAYSLEDIVEIEKSNRTQHTNKFTLTAYVFFADADYASNSGNSKILGIAYGNTSMVVFEKTIRDFSGGLSQPPVAILESTVIHHEVGHVLGLVNNGTVMQSEHQDEPHGKHCDDVDCLMYYKSETSDIVSNLIGGIIPPLNTACKNDLKANGGK